MVKNSASILKNELEGFTAYMKDQLKIEYKKSKTVKYAKQLLKKYHYMKKLIKEERNRMRGLAVAGSDQKGYENYGADNQVIFPDHL